MIEKAYRLQIQSGARVGQEFDLTAHSVTIGRYPLSEIMIEDPDIAYRHAVLTRAGDTYTIADLASESGTYVNGRRIGADPISLNPGDIILLGSRLSAAFLSEVEEMAAFEFESQTDTITDPEAPGEDRREETFSDQLRGDLPETADEPESLPEEEPIEARRAPETTLAEAGARTTHPEPLPALPPPKNKNGRIIVIAAGCLVLLLACCCVSTLFMYFIGGDWLLNQLGYLP